MYCLNEPLNYHDLTSLKAVQMEALSPIEKLKNWLGLNPKPEPLTLIKSQITDSDRYTQDIESQISSFPSSSHFTSEHISLIGTNPANLLRFITFDRMIFTTSKMEPIITQIMELELSQDLEKSKQAQESIIRISKGLFRRDRNDFDGSASYHYHHNNCHFNELIVRILNVMPTVIFEYLMLNFVCHNPAIAEFIHTSNESFPLILRLIDSPNSERELHFLLEKCGMMSTSLSALNLGIFIKKGSVKTLDLVLNNWERVPKPIPNAIVKPYKYEVEIFKKLRLRTDFSSWDRERLETKWQILVDDWEVHNNEYWKAQKTCFKTI